MSDLADDAPAGRRSRRRLIPLVALTVVALFGLFLFANAVHHLSEHRLLWSGVYLIAALAVYGGALVVARWHYRD